MTVVSDASSGGTAGNWLFKNKEHGKTSATASLVCVLCYHDYESNAVAGFCLVIFYCLLFQASHSYSLL